MILAENIVKVVIQMLNVTDSCGGRIKLYWLLYINRNLNLEIIDMTKNRQSRTTCSYFCSREIKKQKRFGMQP